MGNPQNCSAESRYCGLMLILNFRGKQNFKMAVLGDDVLLHIFSFLDIKELCTVSQVCHRWNAVSSTNMLWKSAVFELCKCRKIKAHLGRATTWKDRCIQLVCGRLYPRSATKEKRNRSFDELKTCLVPVEEGKFMELATTKRQGIREFVQSRGHKYVVGRAYYEHTKSETISYKKKIILQDKFSNQIYEGPSVRAMIGLEKGNADWNIQPSSLNSRTTAQFSVFVQSTSVNRALVPRTRLLYQVKIDSVR